MSATGTGAAEALCAIHARAVDSGDQFVGRSALYLVLCVSLSKAGATPASPGSRSGLQGSERLAGLGWLDADQKRHLEPLPVAVDFIEADLPQPRKGALRAAMNGLRVSSEAKRGSGYIQSSGRRTRSPGREFAPYPA
jgi:hypothetical protein